MTKHKPKPKAKDKPKAEQPKPQAKVHEQPNRELATDLPLAYVGSHFVTSETERRIAYALSEKGEVLRINTSGPSYGVVRAIDGGTVLADGQTLTTVRNRARQVDPGIP
jgi:hypothetical protein